MNPSQSESRLPPIDRKVRLRLAIAIGCAIFLIGDALWLASEQSQSSRAGHATARILGWSNRQTGIHPWINLWIAHTPDGPIVAVSPHLLPEFARDSPAATFALWPPSQSTGFWAPTRQDRVSGMYYEHAVGFLTTPLPPAELREPIRDFIAATYQSWHLEKYDELIASGGVGTRPILLGYIHNTLSLAVAIAMLVCSGWLLRDVWRYMRGTRHPYGCCRACGYDRSGLGTESPCPECGEQRRVVQ